MQLYGMGNINKGAQLMLLASIKKINESCPEAVICSSPDSIKNTYLSLGSMGLHQVVVPKGKDAFWTRLLTFLMRKRARREFGLILEKEVDFILDGSGFAYGDYWHNKTDYSALAKRVNRLRSNGGKLILLPQALGPFTKEKSLESFRPVVDNAEIIYARDEQSYVNLINAYGDRSNFKLAPDFTNLLSAQNAPSAIDDHIAIIPNIKMIDNEEKEGNYLLFLKTCIEHIVKNELGKPYFLIHGGKSDVIITRKINKMLDREIPVEWPDNPLVAKAMIKAAKFVIVSRYHGLVSAISQGIPSIATSWSHKYRLLLADYNATDMLVDINSADLSKTIKLIESFSNPTERLNSHRQLLTRAQIEKDKANETWNQIINILKS